MYKVNAKAHFKLSAFHADNFEQNMMASYLWFPFSCTGNVYLDLWPVLENTNRQIGLRFLRKL